MAKTKAKPAPGQKGAPPATTSMKAAQPQKDSVILPAGHPQAADQQAVPSLRAEVTQAFRQALEKSFPQAQAAPVVAQTNEAKFGDYQCNNAMALFGQLKGQVSIPLVLTPCVLCVNAAEGHSVNCMMSHAKPCMPLIGQTCFLAPGMLIIIHQAAVNLACW